MKKALWFVSVIAAVALSSSRPAAAQYCQMYTYHDTWIDANGNAVVLNYTEADLCDGYSAGADVTLTMPSSYSDHDSAGSGQDYFAEAIAFADTSGETGFGSVSGNNSVNYICGSFAAPLSFDFRVNRGVEDIWYDDQLILDIPTNRCRYTRVANCRRDDAVYCGDSFPTVDDKCKDPEGVTFRSMLYRYSYAEIQIGILVIGGCLKPLTSSGTASAPGACTATPPHIPRD